MTTQDTSRESFRLLLESGKLPKAQAKILQAVVGGPDRTSGEICAALGLDNVNGWRARFTELSARGLIVETGTRRCAITGRTALTWRYSDRTAPLPLKHGTSAKALRGLLGRAARTIAAKWGDDIGAPEVKALLADIRAAGVR